MTEQWKDVVGFEGKYKISNIGTLKNIKTGRILKPYLHHSGYYKFSLRDLTFKRRYLIRSRVIALAWVKNPFNKKEVNHINGIKTDDSLHNLEWVNPSENIMHYFYQLDKGTKRAVRQLTLSGEYINTWPSLSTAAKSLNNKKAVGSRICWCCRGHSAKAYGFKWEYA